MLCLPQRSRSQVILDGSWVAGRVPKWLINLWPNLACFSEIVDEDSTCSLIQIYRKICQVCIGEQCCI